MLGVYVYIWIEIWSNVRLVLTLLRRAWQKKKACPGGWVHARWELFFEGLYFVIFGEVFDELPKLL